MTTEFKGNEIYFYSDQEINNNIVIDDLTGEEYYLFLRIKLNNDVNPKYYPLENASENKNIEYYTMTKDFINKKAEIRFRKKKYKSDILALAKLISEEEK
jgi:hypothetical protein